MERTLGTSAQGQAALSSSLEHACNDCRRAVAPSPERSSGNSLEVLIGPPARTLLRHKKYTAYLLIVLTASQRPTRLV